MLDLFQAKRMESEVVTIINCGECCMGLHVRMHVSLSMVGQQCYELQCAAVSLLVYIQAGHTMCRSPL